jgi:hypothetical protein
MTGFDGNGPKRFSVQRKMAIVARLLRGEPLELVARETVSIARPTEWRERARNRDRGGAAGLRVGICDRDDRACVDGAGEHGGSGETNVAASAAHSHQSLVGQPKARPDVDEVPQCGGATDAQGSSVRATFLRVRSSGS